MKVLRIVLASLVLCRVGVALAAGQSEMREDPLIKKRQWKEAEESYEKKLVEFAEAKGPKSEKDLMRLVLFYNIARYLKQMSPEDVPILADWLLEQQGFTSSLLMAFAPEDSPERAFHVLAQLKEKFEERKLLGFEGLAIAHAVVWDKKKPISKKFSAADSFGYYISNARSSPFTLSQMPFEPALSLACAEATPEERLWALKSYKRPKTLSAIYHAPDYDTDFLFGKPKKIDQHEYTLQNLLKYGGVCGDRAYFAANVARALGIPAAQIYGMGERGGHVWTGHILPGKGDKYVWDLACGRYAYDRYYIGLTRDPQTGQEINDYELAMKTMGCSLGSDKIKLANGYVILAGVLEKEQKFPLVKWALEQALKNNRFNLAAWGQATRLCKDGTFDDPYADHIFEEALKKLPDELDFCYGVFSAFMATLPKEQLARQRRLYQQASNFFKARPDLTVAIASSYGDYLLEMEKKREAYAVYYDTIRTHMSDPRLVADTAIKVSRKRLEGDEPKKAVTLLTTLIKFAEKPPLGDPFAKDSAWYRLNQCLEDVYKEMGEQKAADAIEAQLSKYKRR